MGRGNADGGDGGSDYDEDHDDDDDGILNGQSQIIRADMLIGLWGEITMFVVIVVVMMVMMTWP